MKKPATHDIARLRRLVAEIDDLREDAPYSLMQRLRDQEGATIDERPYGSGVFRIKMAGVKVQTTSGRVNCLLMWQGKARDISTAAEGALS